DLPAVRPPLRVELDESKNASLVREARPLNCLHYLWQAIGRQAPRVAARHTFRGGTPHHEADRVAPVASAKTVAQSIGARAGPATRLMAKLGPRSVSRPHATRTTLARGTDSGPQWSGREHG